MRELFKLMLLVFMLPWLVVPAWGEYYKYTDADGVLRFTDDLSRVPTDQRPDVTHYASIKSASVESDSGQSAPRNAARAAVATPKNGQPSNQSWKESISRQADALDRTQMQLTQTYQALQTERARLQGIANSGGVPTMDSKAYRDQVAALNEKIVGYEDQMAAFRQDVKVFNAKLK